MLARALVSGCRDRAVEAVEALEALEDSAAGWCTGTRVPFEEDVLWRSRAREIANLGWLSGWW